MSTLANLQQQRLLYWAQQLQAIASGTREALSDREVAALGKLVEACEAILYPSPPVAHGVHDKNGNTR